MPINQTNQSLQTFHNKTLGILLLSTPPIFAMASSFSTTLLVLLLALFSSLQCTLVASDDFQVGDLKGWTVPPSNDTNMFNNWASNKRFHVGNTIHFKYKKDSVMEVGEEDYKNCNATQPISFSNNGSTLVKLDHSGTFYFISGASGHCEKGQKMIVRVMVQDQDQHQHVNSYGYHVLVSPIRVFLLAFLAYSYIM